VHRSHKSRSFFVKRTLIQIIDPSVSYCTLSIHHRSTVCLKAPQQNATSQPPKKTPCSDPDPNPKPVFITINHVQSSTRRIPSHYKVITQYISPSISLPHTTQLPRPPRGFHPALQRQSPTTRAPRNSIDPTTLPPRQRRRRRSAFTRRREVQLAALVQVDIGYALRVALAVGR
jgi:hypothetical protein